MFKGIEEKSNKLLRVGCGHMWLTFVVLGTPSHLPKFYQVFSTSVKKKNLIIYKENKILKFNNKQLIVRKIVSTSPTSVKFPRR